MPRFPTREARKSATCRSIQEAALRCFARDGFSKATIASITREAGVAHGTFYVHFSSKEAVLDKLLANFNREWVAQLEQIWIRRSADGLLSLLHQCALNMLDHWEKHRDFVEAYAQRLSTGLDLRQLRDGINPGAAEFVSSRLRVAAAGLGLRLDHPELLTQAILALWSRIAMQYVFNQNVEREAAAETLVAMTAGAIQGLASQTSLKGTAE